MQPKRFVPTTLLFLVVAATPALGGEPVEDEAPRVALVRAVAASPVDLWRAVARSQAKKRRVLRAGFAQSTEGQLVLRVLLRSAPESETEFEEWTGVMSSECWIPQRRVLEAPGEIAEARRLHALITRGKRSIAEAVNTARGVKDEDGSRPGVALSIEPTLAGEQVRTVSLVAHDERLHRVTQVLDSGIILSTEPTDELPESIEAPPGYLTRELPPLAVPGGIWFNADVPPTLAGSRGRPLLIVVADPG